MRELIHFFEFLIGAILALIALFIVLLVVISRMPPENPLRRILNLLLVRIGARINCSVAVSVFQRC